ncbi:MAG: hypothetical protein AAGA77_10770 [Bacteroidota bacterium]
MKSSTLIFRSTIVIFILAGFAHYFTYANQSASTIKNEAEPLKSEMPPAANENVYGHEAHTSNSDIPLDQDPESKPEVRFLIGTWKVKYTSEEFTGAVVYKIKKEGSVYNAYTYRYEDENGYSEKAEEIKSLTIKPFSGNSAKGMYRIAYEGEKYEVECQIKKISDTSFSLSYDYYGYSDTETWKKQ